MEGVLEGEEDLQHHQVSSHRQIPTATREEVFYKEKELRRGFINICDRDNLEGDILTRLELGF